MASEAMPSILADQARRKLSFRHGGEWQHVTDLSDITGSDSDAEETVIVHELLDRLVEKYTGQAEVAKIRVFWDFTLKEIADVHGISADAAESYPADGHKSTICNESSLQLCRLSTSP